MISYDDIVRFNAQSSGREKLIRLCQYVSKLIASSLQVYHSKGKGGNELLDLIFKLKDMEQYFLSCRRLVNFGRCTDQFYSAVRSLHLYDPILRSTLTVSKLSTSFQMFADHVLWLNQVGFLQIDKSVWLERASKYWLYAASVNLLRDFYELICTVQQNTRILDRKDSKKQKNTMTIQTPLIWIKQYPKLSCDLIKNACEIWIPYSKVNNIKIHPLAVAILGIISTSCSIMQVYDQKYRLLPS